MTRFREVTPAWRAAHLLSGVCAFRDITAQKTCMHRLRALPLAAAVAATLATAFAAAPGLAQDQTPANDQPAQLQEVIVTGSPIKGNPDVASSNPITVISTTELQNSNSGDLETVLAKLPSVGTDGLNSAESSNFGGNGFEFIDLRNLGPQRTLVLVDGQRFVTSANSGAFAGVDFNNIPTDFVDHIEVLRDGASPVYGSDAVAGVINIITKQHLGKLPPGRSVMLKLTLPEQDEFYAELVRHPNVLKVVALSGGYSRDEANTQLRRNHGIVASFSRALVEDPSAQQSEAEFDAVLDAAIQSIFKASLS